MNQDLRTRAREAPLEIVLTADDTNGEYVRAEAIVRPPPGQGTAEAELPHRRWFEEAGPTLHIHPGKHERIEVLEGAYRVRSEGEEWTLSPGEDVHLPAGRPHAHWNPTDGLARIAVEHYPGGHSAEMFQALYRAAQAGGAMRDGLPRPLQLAVISARYPDVVYTAWLPVSLQKRLNRLAAPLGRLLGYRA